MRKTVIFCVLLFLLFSVGAEAKSEVTKEKQKLKNIKEELFKQKEILAATRKKEKAALGKLAKVKNELTKTTNELKKTNINIKKNESRLRKLSVEIVENQKQLKKQSKTLQKRVVEVYKNGGDTYYDLLFNSSSLSDFVNRSYYFGRILEKDVALISSVERAYWKTKHRKTELREVTGQIKKLAKVIDNKKKIIGEKEAEQQKLYNSLKRRRAEYERRIAELEKSSIQLESLVKNKLTERAKEGLAGPRGTGHFIWPLKGRITSVFGYRRHPIWGGSNFHTGLDIANVYGSSIRAADTGEVIFSGWWDGYGKAVVIDHGKGFSTVYGHLSRIYVRNKKKVAKGQVIGLEGSTGYSTGPHLHFEVRKNGKPVDPQKWLP